MSKMIQVRNVPEDLHRRLKARAALAGLSLSDYLLREIDRVAARPTLQEWVAALKAAEPVSPAEDSAAAVRAERDAR